MTLMPFSRLTSYQQQLRACAAGYEHVFWELADQDKPKHGFHFVSNVIATSHEKTLHSAHLTTRDHFSLPSRHGPIRGPRRTLYTRSQRLKH
jgi:hypothetical protein